MASRRRVAIAIDGASSTGKTTLFDELREEFGGRLDFIPDSARAVGHEFGLNTVTDWERLMRDPGSLAAFHRREKDWILSAQRRACRFVIDSSLYVLRAYMRYFGTLLPENEPKVMRYDLVLLCPATIPLIEDGFRFSFGRDLVDEFLHGEIDSCPPRKLVVLSSFPARRRAASQAIREALSERAVDAESS